MSAVTTTHEGIGALANKYARAISGDVARLFIQLFYFYLVANTLSIEEFGLFATASSVGIVLSRLSGFGFLSPLYRISTVKPHLIGVYSAGYMAAVMLSLPVVIAVGALVYWLLFVGQMSWLVFALIAGTEIFFWRTLEVVININKGLERFGRASIIIVFGFLMKAGAAIWLALLAQPDLAEWAMIYAFVQGAMAVAAVTLFYPRYRLRFTPRLYRRRIPDALAVSGAEVLFYIQMELDKLVVLAFGGAQAAGIYAIIMRLVDLTAMPVRTFSTILTQRLMRRPALMNSLKMRAGFEAGVFLVSTFAIASMVAVLWFKPDILGQNVAQAATLLALVMLVPAFRNLVEYQAELLYGRGQTFIRLVNYAIIGAVKATLLIALLSLGLETGDWLIWTNVIFGVLYLISFCITYWALGRDAKAL